MSQGKSGTGNWLTTSLLFFLGWVFMYADRTILSPVQGVIREEFLLSNAEVGLITSVFFIMYTAVQIPSGLLGDRFGRTKIILFGFMVFGAATALTHFASSFLMLILIRILAGFGEGFYYGPQYAISSDSTPPKYRALGYAIINNGQAVGITLGLIGSSYISFGLDLGWARDVSLLRHSDHHRRHSDLSLREDRDAREEGGAREDKSRVCREYRGDPREPAARDDLLYRVLQCLRVLCDGDLAPAVSRGRAAHTALGNRHDRVACGVDECPGRAPDRQALRQNRKAEALPPHPHPGRDRVDCLARSRPGMGSPDRGTGRLWALRETRLRPDYPDPHFGCRPEGQIVIRLRDL